MSCVERKTGGTPPEWIWITVGVPYLLGRTGAAMDLWLMEHGQGEWKRPTMSEMEAYGPFGAGLRFVWAFSDANTAMAFKLRFG